MKMQQMPLAFVVLAGAAAAPALAQYMGSSGRSTISSVAEVRSAGEASRVSLNGALIAHHAEDVFIFRDASGDIPVRIDTALWRGADLGPGTEVRLTGATAGRGERRRVEVNAFDLQ
ncbi:MULTISPECIES: NirD/YgiW/YdeI family stress tolerance protein [Haematobacter]|uniref:Uncharacterized protein n=1 Tax=Haematobacter genomosp. 1 TaxID=366618 RepID=A0A212A9N4_9RHOB|nr:MULTISPECIES: NirD/YgiW/YdeI family stress tolerance protein [Haematobacter]OWJ76818.1 hypothetical protein CDV49_13180 [Haematobacter genomosp. 1]